MEHHARLLRSFSRQLGDLRIVAGSPTQETLALHMRCSTAKVNRILAGNRAISFSDLLLLLSILDADDATRTTMNNTWALLKDSSPAFAKFRDILSVQEVEYFEALQYADLARLSGNQLVPVILRVPQYHDAVLRSQQHGPDIQRWKQLLPLVQEVANVDRTLHVMLDESVFLRWNTPGFHDQLDALLIAHEAGASIQVMAFTTALHRGMLQAFSILCWNEDPSATQMCFCWTHKQIDWLADPIQRESLTGDWNSMLTIGTDPDQLPAIVELAHRQKKRGLRTVIAA